MPSQKASSKNNTVPSKIKSSPPPPNWPPLRPLVPASDLYIEPLLKDQVYLIRNFFTANLCKSYISFLSSPSTTTGINLTTTPLKPKSRDDAVRVNDRFQVQDAAFAEMLWSSTSLKEIVCERRGVDGDYDDQEKDDREENARIWGGTPLGLNPNIRIYRYTPGQFFAQHWEKAYKTDDESNTIQFPETPLSSSKTLTARTTWTLLIYLTMTEGGETVFYPEEEGSAPISVAPEVGMALLHRHGEHCLLHEGKECRTRCCHRPGSCFAFFGLAPSKELSEKVERTSCDGLDLTALLCSLRNPVSSTSNRSPRAAMQQPVMSSLQTMTAPAAVGHRPPDPGIDIAAAAASASSHAIVDNKDSHHNHDNVPRATTSEKPVDHDLSTDIAASRQNRAVSPVMSGLPQEPPVEVKVETLGNDSGRNLDAVVPGGEKSGEKVNDEQVQMQNERVCGEQEAFGEKNSEQKEGVSASSDSIVKEQKDSPENGDKGQQDQEKHFAATSLLAQLLGNVTAQSAAPGTPENLPRTPLAEPLTDASTPAAPYEDSSMPLTNFHADRTDAKLQQTQVDTENGFTAFSNQEENMPATTTTTEIQDQPMLKTEKAIGDAQDAANAAIIPGMITGVMEDPLSKTSHDPNGGIFAPFDADAAIKNGLDPLQQHDLLANAFLSQEINMSGLPDISAYSASYNDMAASIAGSEPRIQAFAKLEFDDGHFYVNTYSFILGRDVRAARAAFQREMQVRQAMGRQYKNKSSSGGNTSHTPIRVKRDGSAYVGSVSLYDGNGNGNGDAKPVDMLALLPSPDACPTIPIHPPATADGSSAGHKGISRKHVKIAYNFDKSFFEMEVMGRNGAFIGADWLAPGQLRPLHSGDYIQIGGVRIRFLLPDVPIGETGADRLEDTLMGEDGTALAGEAAEDITGDVDAADDSDIDSQEGTDKRVTKLILKTKAPSDSANADVSIDGNPETPQPKRRGPGRPPKDGIMSKRERAEIAREQKLAAKREANGGVTPPPANRIKPPPKPRKEDSVEEPATPKPVEKKKFVKRKQPDGSIIDVPIESIEGGEQLPPEQVVEYPKPPPPKKRKPSRSPSPDYPPESSYTQEQLAKPPYNYAVLIFDALTESQTPMTLKQIYRALKLKYPYFRFKCETEGWTSSVRHNLNGNRQLFEHAERDGKGWSWQLRAGASVEKEKKRRPSPPPPSTHIPHQPPHQHYMPPPSHSYSNQGLQTQQFQFSAHPSDPFNAPRPPQPNPYQRPPAPPAPPAPPIQSSLPAPFRNTNLPPALTQQGPSNYVSPYPCALPPEIIQLQQANRPPPPQPTMEHQRQPDAVPPPQQHQPPQSQLQPQPQPHPPQQQQPHQQTQPNQSHQQHPPPSFASYSPPVNNQIQQYPQSGQLPPSTPQQPSQTMHPVPQQQAYQPQHQQHSQQPQHQPPPPPSCPPTAEPESSMSFLERANKAIDDFEAVLTEDYDDKNYIREVLKSARARALGHADKSSFPDGEPKDEAVLLDALRNLIGSLKDE
ncbi:hypothetical protein UA08_05587 [Talaromyces atroroseus]|uniref:Fe2OG dioxygenase domain-containing protein n=1 Tax=Talaromyces atroroseus TaxID=1441469 RepID=A0A225ADF6_TALAT|nr:hypothetical protein UA08_05587 [Talaromyces atroroseus]OKL59201.1 hypothetical protein UA08_05587 [Talaromyces atroroseus]